MKRFESEPSNEHELGNCLRKWLEENIGLYALAAMIPMPSTCGIPFSNGSIGARPIGVQQESLTQNPWAGRRASVDVLVGDEAA
jgi:hypothetical protein